LTDYCPYELLIHFVLDSAQRLQVSFIEPSESLAELTYPACEQLPTARMPIGRENKEKAPYRDVSWLAFGFANGCLHFYEQIVFSRALMRQKRIHPVLNKLARFQQLRIDGSKLGDLGPIGESINRFIRHRHPSQLRNQF
jgi:hypothetical protein